MGINFDEIRRQLDNFNIGHEITTFKPSYLPVWEHISSKKMVWADVAVLYADLNGYTRITNESRMETTARLLLCFHFLMVNAVNQCGGRVLGFAGDRIMAVFNKTSIEDTIHEAVECALGIQSIVRFILNKELETRNFDYTLSCSVGLDYGTVLISKIGAGQSVDIALVGNSANLSAKFQEYAGKNETFVSNRIYDKFPDWINVDLWKKETINVKGIGTLSGWKSTSHLTKDNKI